MNPLTDILRLAPVTRVRRNHALEHATLQVLAARKYNTPLAGYSDNQGFWVIGDVPTEDLQTAANDAATRLRAGESQLAIHPHCGTNYVTSGLAAGSVAWLTMATAGSSLQKKLERFPFMIALVTLALIVTQPLGLLLQSRVTTDANIGEMQIAEIVRYQRQGKPLHRVLTKG